MHLLVIPLAVFISDNAVDARVHHLVSDLFIRDLENRHAAIPALPGRCSFSSIEHHICPDQENDHHYADYCAEDTLCTDLCGSVADVFGVLGIDADLSGTQVDIGIAAVDRAVVCRLVCLAHVHIFEERRCPDLYLSARLDL